MKFCFNDAKASTRVSTRQTRVFAPRVLLRFWAGALAVCLASGATWLAVVISRTGAIRSESVAFGALDPGYQYSLLYSLNSLRNLGGDARVDLELRQGQAILCTKTLHAGDPDYYTQFR